MQKTVASLLTVCLLALFSATTVSALEVVVKSDGNVWVYQDGVLGDTTELDTSKIKQFPTKNISATEDKILRVRNTGDQRSVEVVDKDLKNSKKATKIEAERLRLQMNAAPLPIKDASPSAEHLMMRKEVKGEEAQKRLEERKERLDEKIELRRATAASKSALELRSRDVRATIPESREIIVDPETNEVGIILPNGEIKSLNFLPDQAQEKIATRVANIENLELTTLDDGRVVYQTTVPQVVHLLGIIKRNVTTDVTLDDSTGEVVEEKRVRNPLDRILNALSF